MSDHIRDIIPPLQPIIEQERLSEQCLRPDACTRMPHDFHGMLQQRFPRHAGEAAALALGLYQIDGYLA